MAVILLAQSIAAFRYLTSQSHSRKPGYPLILIQNARPKFEKTKKKSPSYQPQRLDDSLPPFDRPSRPKDQYQAIPFLLSFFPRPFPTSQPSPSLNLSLSITRISCSRASLWNVSSSPRDWYCLNLSLLYALCLLWVERDEVVVQGRMAAA